jgi:cellulose biosynthesis protein BcsQ
MSEIITFYSYKGGTGRTMALANVACLLANRRSRVLVVDWDLEAPGLHRYFPARLAKTLAFGDYDLDSTPGLMDLFTALDAAIPAELGESEEAIDEATQRAIASIGLERFISDTGVPGVRILRAGSNDDGRYSVRVGAFAWEALFRRAPNVYRKLAEQLGQTFDYVLIDSRTGVTDISGICTSLLPEKLVVVFTPNRQSLSGIRDLVQRTTAYRRSSDDLRPLLVYPLPSRIEVSLEPLRKLWRFGDPTLGIVGYQPMFESVFSKAYGLSRCDMSAYFTVVQIQQDPDYAYGEEIAVLRSGDRFSLGNSYSVFAECLVSDLAPWEWGKDAMTGATGVATAAVSTSRSTGIAPSDDMATRGSRAATNTSFETAPAGTGGSGRRVFLSYAADDRDRAARISRVLEQRGFEVFSSRDVESGDYTRSIANELDRSDVVVVCWSKASVGSQWVLDEAGEGLRRGILIPVLLDDVSPPILFRSVHSADLRRAFDRGIESLATAVAAVAEGRPGTAASPGVPIAAPREARRRWPWAVAACLAAAFAVVLLVRPSPDRQLPTSPPPLTTTVPNFVGTQAVEARRVIDIVGNLRVSFVDEGGTKSASLEGVVIRQSPPAEEHVPLGTTVQLTVEAKTTSVPSLIGLTLDAAVVALTRAQLRLGGTESQAAPNLTSGTIIAQSPSADTAVVLGSAVKVTVAIGSGGRGGGTPGQGKLFFTTVPSKPGAGGLVATRTALSVWCGDGEPWTIEHRQYPVSKQLSWSKDNCARAEVAVWVGHGPDDERRLSRAADDLCDLLKGADEHGGGILGWRFSDGVTARFRVDVPKGMCDAPVPPPSSPNTAGMDLRTPVTSSKPEPTHPSEPPH